MNEEGLKRSENYIDRIQGHKEISESRAEYAMKRLDVMILALSSSGIYFGLEFISTSKFYCVHVVIGCLVLFLLTIVINLLSQWYGFLSNEAESKWAELELAREKDEQNGKESSITEINKLAKKSDSYSTSTNKLNKASTIVMVIGLLTMCIVLIFWVFEQASLLE